MAKETTIVRYAADFSSYEKSIKDAQRTFDSFARGLGLNVGKLTAVGAAIGAVTGALKVAKDAFFKNEEQLDEWGRTVKSAESLYGGFLNALNTGNISGYLQNMNNIVNAARAAYDAMDALGTFNAFNQINQAKAQTNLTNAIADFREGTGSKDAVRLAADALKNELQQRQKYEQEAYDAAVSNLAAQRGVSASDLMKAMSGSYGNYQTLKNVMPTGSKTVFQSNGQFGGTTSYNVAVPANEAERLGEALRQLNDTEIQSLQALGAAAQRTANEIANTDKQVARVLRGNTGGTGSNGGNGTSNKETYVPAIGSIDEMRAKVKELQEAFNQAADQGVRGQLLVAIDEAQKKLDYMSGKGLSPLTRDVGSLTDRLGLSLDTDKLRETIKPIDIDNSQRVQDIVSQWIGEIESKDKRDSQDNALQKYDKLIGGLSAVSGGLKSMGINLPEEVDTLLNAMQGISAVITGVQSVIEIFSAGGMTANTLALYSNTAAVIALTAAMDTNSILSLLPFSHGGIVKAANGLVVPGNSFSGDNLRMPIMDGIGGLAGVNSGELILNRSQQDRIASQLSGGGMQNLHLTATIKGTDIQLALNNTARQQGRGVYVTSR
jgi:hypothetical protein